MKALLPGQQAERKVLKDISTVGQGCKLWNRDEQSQTRTWACPPMTVLRHIFKNMKSMMTQCLQIAHEQGRKMDAELEAECLKTVFNCDYFWTK